MICDMLMSNQLQWTCACNAVLISVLTSCLGFLQTKDVATKGIKDLFQALSLESQERTKTVHIPRHYPHSKITAS